MNQVDLLVREIEQLAGDRDSSTELERTYGIRREIARVSEILNRLGETRRVVQWKLEGPAV